MVSWYSWFVWRSLPSKMECRIIFHPIHAASWSTSFTSSIILEQSSQRRLLGGWRWSVSDLAQYTPMHHQYFLAAIFRPEASDVQVLADKSYTNSIASEISVLILLFHVQQLYHLHSNLDPPLRHRQISASVLLRSDPAVRQEIKAHCVARCMLNETLTFAVTIVHFGASL